MKAKKYNRNSELARLRSIINRDSYPRLEMFLLVSFTGGAGFLTSSGLLHLGLTTMWTRYLLSIGVAYLVFLAMLGVWLFWKTHNNTTDLEDALDIVDSSTWPSGSTNSGNTNFHGHGGTFDGGGASADYSSHSEGAGAMGDAFEAAASAEEGAIPLVVIGALLFALLSIFWVVFSLVAGAPVLFSELLVDGMLSASLYNRLKGIDSHHWLESAFKRTFWPFFWTTITFVVLGLVIGHFLPHLHSLGEVISLIGHK